MASLAELTDPGARHIPAPLSDDWYASDEYLRWLVRRLLPADVWPIGDAALSEAGRLVPERIEPLVRLADRHAPVLRQYDAQGQRIDEIEFHPAYREIEQAVTRFGVIRAAYVPGWRGLPGRAPRTLLSAILYLFLQADQAITGCPLGMTDAMARCLERNDPALAARFVPHLADDSGDYWGGAMFLTEKAGGSDVGANETVARRAPDGTWRLTGEKWFSSCPHSQLILVMARPEGAQPGPRGLGLFLMPRHLDDGSRNSYVIHRLKDKFGTRSMPSGEVGLRDAFAWQVGDLDRGMRQMMDMVSLTRVEIATAAAAAMRRNAHEALHHTASRITFGRRLQDHPLMADTLAELVVDATAGLSAAMGVTELLDAADGGDSVAAAALRVMTPLCKTYCTERARVTATEAMEVRGGNGFIEDWPDARILRDVYVHAIWEGSSNVVALDVLRALGSGAGPGFLEDLERRTEEIGEGPASSLGGPLMRQTQALRRDLEALAALGRDAQQLRMRRLTRRMAVLAIASRLAVQANEFAADTGSGRLAWLAARFAARLGGEALVAALADDQDWLEHAPALLNGGPVPLETGERAARRVADASH